MWRNEGIGGWEKDGAEGFRVPECRASVHGKGSVRVSHALSRWAVEEGADEEEEGLAQTAHTIQVIIIKSMTLQVTEIVVHFSRLDIFPSKCRNHFRYVSVGILKINEMNHRLTP